MIVTRWRMAGFVLLAFLAVGVGTGVVYRLKGAEPGGPAQAAAAKDGADKAPAAPDAEATLKKALVDAARTTYEEDVARLKNNQGVGAEEIYLWSRRWLEAEVDLAGSKEERVTAHRHHLARMKELEKMTKAFADTGQGRGADATAGTFFRTQAELWLSRAEGQ